MSVGTRRALAPLVWLPQRVRADDELTIDLDHSMGADQRRAPRSRGELFGYGGSSPRELATDPADL